MFGTLAAALALALIPAQPGALNLTNVRATYGELGPVRTDNKFLPGDVFFLSFDIEGITFSAEGKASFAMIAEVTNRAGQVVFKPDKPGESEAYLPLGGNRLPAWAFYPLALDQAPGIYTCKVVVTDRANRATKELVRTFEVVPKTLGLVLIMTSYDDKGDMAAPPVGSVGQNLNIHGMITGFGRGPDRKPNAVVELRVFDEARRPTVPKPLAAAVPKEVPDNDDRAMVRFLVPFNREGSFTAELKAIDNTTGKTSVVSFPIKVGPPAK